VSKYLPKIVGFSLNILSFISLKSATSIALQLFSKPRKGQITKEQSEFLDTAVKQVFEYQNNQIATYHWHGKNQTILLIHGWESNTGRWMDLILGLQEKNFNIIALDAPAHGNSGSKTFNVPLYAEYIHTVTKNFNPNIVVAHSLGGMSTVFSISKYQVQNIKKLILIGVPSEYIDVLERYKNMLGYNNRIVLNLNQLITDRFGLSPKSLSTVNNLEKIDSKGLIIHDEDDDVIPYNDALLIQNSFKNSKLITTKGLGHSLKDKSVSSKILEFITS
jgi:pimeloyl-ACP methyl ester carboxylesterase